jgi:hypothetical protein
MIGARVREQYDLAAKERQKRSKGRGQKGPANLPDLKSSDSRDQAGNAVGVSGKSIDAATKVLKKGSKALHLAVDTGGLSVTAAAKLAELPKAEQNREVKNKLTRGRRPKKQQSAEVTKVAGKQLANVRRMINEIDEQVSRPAETVSLSEVKQRIRWLKRLTGGYRAKPRATGRPATTDPGDNKQPFGLGDVDPSYANDAINLLSRIPEDDPHREQDYRAVMDWIETKLSKRGTAS